MRLTYIVKIELDDRWVADHPNYTPEFIHDLTTCRLSDAVRYDPAYLKSVVHEVCDGEHGGSPCSDPECWAIEECTCLREPGALCPIHHKVLR